MVRFASTANLLLHKCWLYILLGISYFVFKHDDEYQEAQFEFLSAVATHNPNALMFLLSRYPYHVDTLLQVSEMAKQSGDWTMAGDCIGEL